MAFTQEQKKSLVAVVVFGIIANGLVFYYWNMLGKPEFKKAESEKAKAISERDRFDALYEEINRFKTENQEEYRRLEELIQLTSKRLPSSIEAPGFLQALGDVVRGTGIEGKLLVPAAPKPYQDFTQIPYQIEALGRYHQFGQFVNLIEENTSAADLDRRIAEAGVDQADPEPKRFMRIRTMSLTNSDDRPSLHPIEIDIATFMFNPPKPMVIKLPAGAPAAVKNKQKELW